MVDEKNEHNLLAHLETIASSLAKLALFRELDAFYSPDERKQLVAEYRALMEADAVAFSGVKAAHEKIGEAGSGREARDQKCGEEEAARRQNALMAAFDVRRATSNKVSEFRRRHAIIITLLRTYPAIDEPPPTKNEA